MRQWGEGLEPTSLANFSYECPLRCFHSSSLLQKIILKHFLRLSALGPPECPADVGPGPHPPEGPGSWPTHKHTCTSPRKRLTHQWLAVELWHCSSRPHLPVGGHHPKLAEYTFFSSADGAFSRKDHMLGHKKVSMNLRELKSYQASFATTMLWDQKSPTTKKKNTKTTNTWRVNNMLLSNEWITEEIKKEIKNTWRQMKMKRQFSKIYGTQQKQF